jgi:hypothetical protein
MRIGLNIARFFFQVSFCVMRRPWQQVPMTRAARQPLIRVVLA